MPWVVSAAALLVGALVVYTFVAADANVRFGVISGSLALFGSIGSVGITQWYSRTKEIQAGLRERKTPLYTKIFDFYMGLVSSVKGITKSPSEREMLKQIFDISKQLMIWGSEDVLKEWSRMRMISETDMDSQKKTIEMIKNTHDLFRAIRRDLGHDDRNLSQEEYLRVFLGGDVVELLKGNA
jgi:hypothetical protein